MAATVAVAERQSPREILARQFRALTTLHERGATMRPFPISVEPWFEEAELEREHQRAAARKAAAKRRAMARKAKSRKQTVYSSPKAEKRYERGGIVITLARLTH